MLTVDYAGHLTLANGAIVLVVGTSGAPPCCIHRDPRRGLEVLRPCGRCWFSRNETRKAALRRERI